MHEIGIRQEILDRVLARRGRIHLFDQFAAAETAMVIIDMQPTFVAPGSPAEVPAARGIVVSISQTANAARAKGVLIVWVTHANTPVGSGSDWDGFFNVFVADEVRERTIASLSQNSPDTQIWHEFDVADTDLHVFKNRYSALIQGLHLSNAYCAAAASGTCLSPAPRPTSAVRQPLAMQ